MSVKVRVQFFEAKMLLELQKEVDDFIHVKIENAEGYRALSDCDLIVTPTGYAAVVVYEVHHGYIE